MKDINEITLKPCPRCQGKCIIRFDINIICGHERGGYVPYCNDCLIAPSYGFFTEQDAADWWNERCEKE